MSKKTTAAERRRVEYTLRQMMAELGVEWLEVSVQNGSVWLDWHTSGDETTGVFDAANLDDAFVLATHKRAGTEPAPF